MKALRALLFTPLLLSDDFAHSQVSQQPYKPVFEKVYVQTDRSLYAAGEDIWFKAYLVNAQTDLPWNNSNNLYVELLSADNMLNREVIRLDNGSGYGDIHLGDSIAAGIYRLRAYTSWMRNFGENFFFEKRLDIVSALGGAAKGAVSAKRAPTSAPASLPVTATNNAQPVPLIRFFPEGGSLVEGAPGLVAVRAEANGIGIAAAGTIVSAAGEQVAVFTCDSAGLGTVQLPAVAAVAFTAEGKFGNGTPFRVPLPAPAQSGYALFVKQTDSLLRLTISTNPATLAAAKGAPLVILAKSKGKAVHTSQFVLTDLSQTVSIRKDAFPPGISALTVYDHTGKPQCERLVFIEGANKARLTVTTNKPLYVPKEQVTVNLNIADAMGKPVKADLSLAAVDDAVAPVDDNDIVSYLQLTSELKGAIDRPRRYFDPANRERLQQLDLLLLTQGWRDFLWKRLADTTLRVTHPVERGITVSGKVTRTTVDKPIAGANVTLSAPGARGQRIFGVRTDSSGRYYFDDVRLYGDQMIRLSSKNDKAEKLGMLVQSPLFEDAPPVNRLTTPQLTDTVVNAPAGMLLARRDDVRKLGRGDTISLNEVKLTGRKEVRLYDQTVQSLGYPDDVMNVDPKDYDMTNIFHYLTTYAKNARVADVPFLRTSDGLVPVSLKDAVTPSMDTSSEYHTMLYFPGDRGSYAFPRIFVNGRELPFTTADPMQVDMMVSYQQTVFNLPVSKLKKIDIKHMIGAGATDMYLVYLTFNQDVLNETPYLAYNRVSGYYEARTFFAPIYAGPSARSDLRTTIHWSPAIATNENGQATVTFYNADPKTRVRVMVEGVTATGGPVSATATYAVK